KFKVKAPKILLEEIYRTGMGSRLSQGFGLLEYLGGEIKDEV
ncbi:MAG: CRISPR-associated endoribonuclease Cas6, partial [Fusobacterium polymorphum]